MKTRRINRALAMLSLAASMSSGARAAAWNEPGGAQPPAPVQPAQAAPAAQAYGAMPDNQAATRAALRKACSDLEGAFIKMETVQIPGGRDMGITGTMERHETLQRLLIEAWALKCDLAPFVQMEVSRVEQESARYSTMNDRAQK